ncbi:alpha/beta hydrolase family protein [Aspergillus affinis]|uniref:alpha/beta hydrolase family protein n=1 Tax=Aspergillus affinis TaxID=1070780 RepID=UPI0022FEFA9F|nr:uncharacterized protein KD926_005659 [Aspergillus affinis]KAI9042364.1 hypothetical protein KD926_005659 [Aspergillus affinis]
MKLSVYTGPLLATIAYGRAAVATNSTEKAPTLQLSTSAEFNFQLLIALGDATSGGADIGPVLGAANEIRAGDMAHFSRQFYRLANSTKAQAEDPENAFDPINVRDTWFSASQYFRRADFYGHHNWSNPLINTLWAEQTAAFDEALAALHIPGKRVQIPSPEGNFTVESIWYGPGQPTVRRNQNLGFIPHWENVVTPVVDWIFAEKADAVDTDRLVLIGNSFGGYLAARAAAFEPRLSAAVLIGGVWDTYAGFSGQFPSELIGIYEAGNYTDFDRKVHSLRETGKLPTSAAWGVDQGLWSFHTHSPSEFLNMSQNFRLEDAVDKIKIPVFVGDAEFENFFKGQPKKVKDALGDRATLHDFKGVAGYHCQIGAAQELTRTMFAWINKTLG